MSRFVKRWHNMDIVLHGPMPSKPCPQSTYAQGRHAFTAPVRDLAMSSVTTNADEVAPLLRLRTERCYQVRLIADEAKCAWSKMADGTFAAPDARIADIARNGMLARPRKGPCMALSAHRPQPVDDGLSDFVQQSS